jgi:ABC-type Mn2+/Zn2+ transport system ATPase subunit
MIVSHDEDLLDSVCTDIIHLDQQRLFYYKGNYSVFKDQVGIHKGKMLKDYDKQEKQLRTLKQQGRTNKKAAEELAKKNKREAGGVRGRKGAQQDEDEAGAGGKSLVDQHLLSRPKDYQVVFTFPDPPPLSPPIIQVNDVSFGYAGGKTLFKKLSFGVDMDSRITIVGPNGVGKSTLLKLMTGELKPTKGQVKINRSLKIARYHQHFVDVLPRDESPVEFLRRTHSALNVSYQEARNRLGKFGLEGTAHEIKMLNCSGGQKARVVLASLSFQNPHLLILDEPTNNLDIESIGALIDAINDLEGGVIVVTHDARLITSTECVLWVCEDRTVYEQVGGERNQKPKNIFQYSGRRVRGERGGAIPAAFNRAVGHDGGAPGAEAGAYAARASGEAPDMRWQPVPPAAPAARAAPASQPLQLVQRRFYRLNRTSKQRSVQFSKRSDVLVVRVCAGFRRVVALAVVRAGIRSVVLCAVVVVGSVIVALALAALLGRGRDLGLALALELAAAVPALDLAALERDVALVLARAVVGAVVLAARQLLVALHVAELGLDLAAREAARAAALFRARRHARLHAALRGGALCRTLARALFDAAHLLARERDLVRARDLFARAGDHGRDLLLGRRRGRRRRDLGGRARR